MKLPPWLAGLLMVLVLAALWWALSGTSEDEPPQSSRPTEATQARPEQPSEEEGAAEDPSGADQSGDDPFPMGIDTRDWDDIEACRDDDLPATMIPVIEDIWAGGPYDYPEHDAGRFVNYEGFLPDERSGYYREFTVETPGLGHRGARRIVTGGSQEHDPDVWYFTADHYESFCEFTP